MEHHHLEHLHLNEVIVSAHWTPDHIDVTDAPLLYAKPKASWIERLDTDLLARIDSADRAARRALNTRRVVDAREIRELPPIEPVVHRRARRGTLPPLRISGAFVAPMRTLLRRAGGHVSHR